MLLRDRLDAGRQLAARLEGYRAQAPVVVALLRGGAIVGCEVAHALRAPVDLLLARKISAPGRPEDAIGAVAPGVTYLNELLIRRLGIGQRYIDLTIAEENRQLRRQERLFETGHPPALLQGRPAILVDDGVATGATAAAAIESVRRRGPSRVVFATPVCSPDAHVLLKARADELICLVTPPEFTAVSEYYDDFTPITDAVVLAFLNRVGTGDP